MLIRDIITGLYANNEGWVRDIKDAHDFGHARNTIGYNWQQRLKAKVCYGWSHPIGKNDRDGRFVTDFKFLRSFLQKRL